MCGLCYQQGATEGTERITVGVAGPFPETDQEKSIPWSPLITFPNG